MEKIQQSPKENIVKPIHKKVKFRGEVYWLHENDYGWYNLSPLEHYSDDGDIQIQSIFEYSYAIICKGDDRIIRYEQVIGKLSDLEDYVS
jgi:hypothetical protein